MSKQPSTNELAAELLAADREPRDHHPISVVVVDEQPKAKGGKLALLVGASCCAVVWSAVSQFEGNKPVPYRDIAGIWTVCRGDTKDVVPGQAQTEAQCDERFERQLVAHAKPVLECVPQLKSKPNALAAGISLAYNIGPVAFCRSTAAARFRAGNVKGGCDALLMYDRAGGRVVAGLSRRRSAERAICLRDAA